MDFDRDIVAKPAVLSFVANLPLSLVGSREYLVKSVSVMSLVQCRAYVLFKLVESGK